MFFEAKTMRQSTSLPLILNLEHDNDNIFSLDLDKSSCENAWEFMQHDCVPSPPLTMLLTQDCPTWNKKDSTTNRISLEDLSKVLNELLLSFLCGRPVRRLLRFQCFP